MKKLFCFLAITSLALTSCSSSSDDDGGGSSGTVLLKKTVEDYGGGDILTSNYTYNGTKLVKIVSDDGTTENYTYTGNLITKIEYVEDGDVVARETMTYNGSDQLISYTFADIDFDSGSRVTYVWNSANSVELTSYTGDATSQTNLTGTGTITLANGEVTTITTTLAGSVTLTYDTKNNPAKNITGFDKLPFSGIDASGQVTHNVVAENANLGDDYTTTYTYNADNYPTADTESGDGGTDPISTQYFYN